MNNFEIFLTQIIFLLKTNKLLLKTFCCQSIESISKTVTTDSRNILYIIFIFICDKIIMKKITDYSRLHLKVI